MNIGINTARLKVTLTNAEISSQCLQNGHQCDQEDQYRKAGRRAQRPRIGPPGSDALPQERDHDTRDQPAEMASPVDPRDEEWQGHVDEQDPAQLVEHGAACRRASLPVGGVQPGSEETEESA